MQKGKIIIFYNLVLFDYETLSYTTEHKHYVLYGCSVDSAIKKLVRIEKNGAIHITDIKRYAPTYKERAL